MCVYGAGESCWNANRLLLFRKADLVSEKGVGRKNAQVIGEVAVRGDASQPRSYWKRCCSTASLSPLDPRKPGAAAFMLETLHLR